MRIPYVYMLCVTTRVFHFLCKLQTYSRIYQLYVVILSMGHIKYIYVFQYNVPFL